ncbi:MAG: peptide chain release factor H [Treponema sp.]|jgi:peptide chain release factor|nr:peptide chain release factor H [Treponema sp.]
METIWISISAGSGPEECAHAASLTVQVFLEELQNRNIKTIVLESETSRIKGNIRSALIAIEGNEIKSVIRSWVGIIQWVWQSAYRPHHKRKNWFMSVKPHFAPENGEGFSVSDVRFETARAGGPGGQYVNKTESAVRAVHIPTGKSVVASGERSQLMNKKLALARLATLLTDEEAAKEQQSRSKLRHSHWELERGNPIRVYDGDS